MSQRVLDEVWRSHWGRLLGQLMARFHRADLVEDALAEAFAQAAAQWPAAGVPHNPPGWIRTLAHRRVLDALRHERTIRSKARLMADDDAHPGPEEAAGGSWGAVGDDRLPLLFMATHPALAPEVRPALALRFVLGVPTAEIARLFLVPTATMAARLTRAKKRLANTGVPFDVPDRAVWPQRVDDVARAVYLVFTAGYAPASGAVVRAGPAGEAVRLAELAADLLPDQPVLEALVALLLLQHARRDARVSAAGHPVRLAEQDRSRWHCGEIEAGLRRLTALQPTDGLAEELRLQALIAAFHNTASSASRTDWGAIARTYARLERLSGSPIVRLNRAVAVAEATGPMAGLAILQAASEQLPGHHRVALVRAELLRRDGRTGAARRAYTEALTTCPTGAEREYIAERLDQIQGPHENSSVHGGAGATVPAWTKRSPRH